MKYFISAILLTLPIVTLAADGLFAYLPSFINFIANTLIPFIIGIAFLVLVFNIARFFVIESANEEGREKARAYLLYSVIAFVFVLVFWGIINLLVSASSLGGATVPTSDYVEKGTP